jgi:serine/threonine protein kinase
VTLIAGRYQLLDAPRPGAPQRARDLQTAQTVLLRDVRLPRDSPDEALARANAAKGIFHPSLVTLFDVQPQPDGRVLLAYEFVPAQSVAQVTGGHPFNPKRAAEIVTEVADAAAELHARDIPHGGISQGSVIITMKGKAKLDRVADPSLNILVDPSIERDLAALGELLQELVGRPNAAGIAGLQAIETVIQRARGGKFESAASFAAMLRKV